MQPAKISSSHRWPLTLFIAGFALCLLLSLIAMAAMPLDSQRPVQVIYIYSHECTICQHAEPVVRNAAAGGRAQLNEYEINSPDGRTYMHTYGIDTVPALIVGGNVVRFEDFNGDLGKLDALLRDRIEAVKSCPLMLQRNVSREGHDIKITTCIANNGPEMVSVDLCGGLCSSASIVSGESSWRGEIPPGKAQYITYHMKAPDSVKSLPPQTLEYQDSSGSHRLLGEVTPVAVAKKLSIAAAFLAGVVAGINPCLLAVLAFMSTMAISSENHGRELAIDVFAFCGGLLSIYLLIGIGFLRLIESAPTFDETIRLAIVLALVGFAVWSLYDAYSVNRSPGRRSMLSAFIGRLKPFYGRYKLAASFLLGGAFGLIKMPCVGGMYLAILGAIFESPDPIAGVACLISYNAGVVLPVLVLGLLLAVGLSPDRVNAFRLRHRVGMKAFTGILLLAMAAALALNLL